MDHSLLPLLTLPNECRQDAFHPIFYCLPNDTPLAPKYRFQRLYHRLAPFFNACTGLYARLKRGGEQLRAMQYLSALPIQAQDCVMEISIGAGRHIPHLPWDAHYLGVDTSPHMLLKCSKAMRKLGRPITLLQAQAESLPVQDNTFDVVFSAGGFHFFVDKAKAVQEMLRIAKPGATLMIADETEKMWQDHGQTNFLHRLYAQKRRQSPIGFLPPACQDVTYQEICGGDLFVLTFIKP